MAGTEGDDPVLAHRRARRDHRRDPRVRDAGQMTLLETTWVERDGVLWSPALGAAGLVAGFTTRALGSMAGGVFPLDEQERNREALAKRLGFDRVVRLKEVQGVTVVRADADGV